MHMCCQVAESMPAKLNPDGSSLSHFAENLQDMPVDGLQQSLQTILGGQECRGTLDSRSDGQLVSFCTR